MGILQEGGLLLPGDTLLDGSELGAIHTRGGEQRHHVYTSPSVLYSKHDIYTKPKSFEGHMVRLVLQCRQRPGYQVCGETIGWERDHPGVAISPHFSNAAIERFTRARGGVIPYRLLLHLDKAAAPLENPAKRRRLSLIGEAGGDKSLEKFFDRVLEGYKKGMDLECVAHVGGCWIGATRLLPSGQHGEVFYKDSLGAFFKEVKKEYE